MALSGSEFANVKYCPEFASRYTVLFACCAGLCCHQRPRPENCFDQTFPVLSGLVDSTICAERCWKQPLLSSSQTTRKTKLCSPNINSVVLLSSLLPCLSLLSVSPHPLHRHLAPRASQELHARRHSDRGDEGGAAGGRDARGGGCAP